MLADGSRLSVCVQRARDAGDLEQVGSVYIAAAEALAQQLPRSEPAALRLGYLIGAAERGGARSEGVAAELVRRLEQVPGVGGAPPSRASAFQRGRSAGLADG